MTTRSAVKDSIATLASYFVVKFKTDSCISAIPSKRVVSPPIECVEEGTDCTVKWTDGLYEATVMAKAHSLALAKKKEEELALKMDDKEDSDGESEENSGEDSDSSVTSDDHFSPPAKRKKTSKSAKKTSKTAKKNSKTGKKDGVKKKTETAKKHKQDKPTTVPEAFSYKTPKDKFTLELGAPAQKGVSSEGAAASVDIDNIRLKDINDVIAISFDSTIELCNAATQTEDKTEVKMLRDASTQANAEAQVKITDNTCTCKCSQVLEELDKMNRLLHNFVSHYDPPSPPPLPPPLQSTPMSKIPSDLSSSQVLPTTQLPAFSLQRSQLSDLSNLHVTLTPPAQTIQKGPDNTDKPVEHSLENSTENILSTDALIRLKNQSNSRRNFALKQAEQLFTVSERMQCNCQGKRGKKALDPHRLLTIQDNTFRVWPLESGENAKQAWTDCRRAIDEGGRQLNHRLRLGLEH